MILHIVLYQPKASATAEELAELANVLETASREIPSIRQVRVGKALDLGLGYENWPTDHNDGFVAVFEFENELGLHGYLEHPEHKKLAAMLWQTCERPTIIDVSAIDPKLDKVMDQFGQKTD